MAKFAGKKAAKSAGKKGSAFARSAAASAAAEARGAEFEPGEYLVHPKDCQESDNGSYGFVFDGVGEDEEIGERIQWFSTAGKSSHVSGPRIKSLCMAMLGLTDSDEYQAFDPNGLFLDAILKWDLNEAAEYMAEQGVAESVEDAREVLDEANVVIVVTKGGDKDNGGYFRNATFKCAPGADAESDEDEEPESEVAPKAKKKAKAAPAKRKAAPVEDDSEDEDDSDDSEDEDEEPESEPAPAKRKAKAKRK